MSFLIFGGVIVVAVCGNSDVQLLLATIMYRRCVDVIVVAVEFLDVLFLTKLFFALRRCTTARHACAFAVVSFN